LANFLRFEVKFSENWHCGPIKPEAHEHEYEPNDPSMQVPEFKHAVGWSLQYIAKAEVVGGAVAIGPVAVGPEEAVGTGEPPQLVHTAVGFADKSA